MYEINAVEDQFGDHTLTLNNREVWGTIGKRSVSSWIPKTRPNITATKLSKDAIEALFGEFGSMRPNAKINWVPFQKA